MAEVEEVNLASSTCTVGESPTKLTDSIGIAADEVFTNGDENDTTDSNFLHAGYGSTCEQILPRKSSLIKDSSRGSRRKKTVSFSSMPGERIIVNGDCSLFFWGVFKCHVTPAILSRDFDAQLCSGTKSQRATS